MDSFIFAFPCLVSLDIRLVTLRYSLKIHKNGLWKGWQSIVAIPLLTENRSKTDSGRADNQLSPLHYSLKIDQKWTLERADNQLSPLRYSLKIVQKMTLEGLEINCRHARIDFQCSHSQGVWFEKPLIWHRLTALACSTVHCLSWIRSAVSQDLRLIHCLWVQRRDARGS